MKQQTSLQKFTHLDLIKRIEADEIIDPELIKNLTSNELQKLNNYIAKNSNDKDRTVNALQLVITTTERNQLWERNHRSIVSCISNLMQSYNRMPSPNEIAHDTNLSRQSVMKHLKEFKTNQMYLIEQQQFELMRKRVLAALFNFGVQGDVQACKVYLQATNTAPTTQPNNNYIQINGLTINQTAIQNLPPEAIEQLTLMLAKASVIKA